mmetsp:Transcript_35963/g.84084  ORF Transcript_35963/g.84084 Transcript_35963/m.84084 type:complete len:203 (+) Transcript_35963:886-1494(+)
MLARVVRHNLAKHAYKHVEQGNPREYNEDRKQPEQGNAVLLDDQKGKGQLICKHAMREQGKHRRDHISEKLLRFGLVQVHIHCLCAGFGELRRENDREEVCHQDQQEKNVENCIHGTCDAFYKQPHLGMEAKDPENTAQAKHAEQPDELNIIERIGIQAAVKLTENRQNPRFQHHQNHQQGIKKKPRILEHKTPALESKKTN